MRTLRAVLPAALVAGAVAIAPAAAGADTGASKSTHVRAHAAGSGAPPPLPSAVRVRVTRGQKALDKVGEYVDKGVPAKAIASLQGARANMYAAWRVAKWGIVNNPPPPPAAGKAAAHSSGAPVGAGTTYADSYTTAVAVLGFQHEVVVSTYGLIDGAKGALRDELSKTMFAALDRRDAAIAYIHSVPAPPPAAKVVAHSSGAPVGGGDFATLMPGIIPDLDDELLQGTELRAGGALTPGEKRIALLANAQIQQTKTTVNTWWPPVPAG
jgi:hypothetical protein